MITYIEIRADMLAGEKGIDKTLAPQWEESKQKQDFNFSKQIENFLEMRQRIIHPQGFLHTAIWATRNAINWEYGDVVILRGNPEAIIGNDDSKKLGNVCKNEVSLLEPFQNKGNPCCLELLQDDTIIIGPNELLKEYRGIEKYSDKIVFIEELSQEHINFFKIPARLLPQPKQQPSAAKWLNSFNQFKSNSTTTAPASNEGEGQTLLPHNYFR